jgi:hypothetical protein
MLREYILNYTILYKQGELKDLKYLYVKINTKQVIRTNHAIIGRLIKAQEFLSTCLPG